MVYVSGLRKVCILCITFTINKVNNRDLKEGIMEKTYFLLKHNFNYDPGIINLHKDFGAGGFVILLEIFSHLSKYDQIDLSDEGVIALREHLSKKVDIHVDESFIKTVVGRLILNGWIKRLHEDLDIYVFRCWHGLDRLRRLGTCTH